MKIHKTVHTKSGRIDKRKNTGGKLFIAEYKKAQKRQLNEKERKASRKTSSKCSAREREVAEKRAREKGEGAYSERERETKAERSRSA